MMVKKQQKYRIEQTKKNDGDQLLVNKKRFSVSDWMIFNYVLQFHPIKITLLKNSIRNMCHCLCSFRLSRSNFKNPNRTQRSVIIIFHTSDM